MLCDYKHYVIDNHMLTDINAIKVVLFSHLDHNFQDTIIINELGQLFTQG